MKPVRSLFLVADGARARVLERLAPAGTLTEVEALAEERPLPPSRELGTERPGRTQESVGSARHAITPARDPHRELKRAFAGELVATLERLRRERRFDRLYLVAPPATLGDLRAALPPALERTVAGELGADLTRLPLLELRDHLERIELA
jgi:protein required for attachment to host cells